MTKEEALNYVKEAGQNRRHVALTIIKNNYNSQGKLATELTKVVQQMINGVDELSPEGQVAIIGLASKIQSSISPPSATTQEQMMKKEGPFSMRLVETRGDNSDQQQSIEQAYPNGLVTYSDQAHHKVCTAPTNNDHTVSDRTISTGGNEGSDVSGSKSERCGEKSVIVTSPGVVQNNPVAAANAAREELTAAKSGFNDNRDTTEPSIIDELFSIPGEILKAIMKVDEDSDDEAEDDGELESSGVYTSLLSDIAKEVAKVTTSVSKFFSASAIEKAEAVISNKAEKIKTMAKRVNNMRDGATKNRYMEAIKNMDLGILFADPSSENKKKESVRDKDQEVKMAVEATNKALSAEANIN